MLQAAPELVRKSEYAVMRRVSPARVSQWISEGKIGPEAIVGEGQRAQIRVAVADRQLKERLDVTQRFSLNGIFTHLPSEAAPVAPVEELPLSSSEVILPPPSNLPPRPTADDDNSIEGQIKREKLIQQQLLTRRQEREERLSQGVYVLASEMQKEVAKIAGKMLKTFEGGLDDIADAVAAKFEWPKRDLQHLLRTQFTKIRARAAATLKTELEDEPETLQDDESA